MKRFFLFFLLPIIFMFLGLPQSHAFGAAHPYHIHRDEDTGIALMPVIGFVDSHQVREGETLLDIAREHSLGYNEIVLYHHDLDPWMPEEGKSIDIPTQWVLPSTEHQEVVINIPEMRLYRFFQEVNMVKTYPVAVGRDEFNTPVKETRVAQRVKNPSWTVPQEAMEQYGRSIVPPGPDNPLGDYWVGLSGSQIGIHGTNFAWGIGRQVSRGCIRLYPEHAQQFYNETRPGTKVEIVYEPVKLGIRGDLIFMEAHPDIYDRISDIAYYTREKIYSKGLQDRVDLEKVHQVLEEKKGFPKVINN